MFNNSWFVKLKPFAGIAGFGGGATGIPYAGGASWEPSGITATGGTMHTGQDNPDGTPYTWHVFPGGPRGPESPMPYTFSVSAVTGPGKIEYIMVGGGGIGGISPNPDPGGDYGGGGGGGAGGVICNFESPPFQDSKTYHPFYPVSPGAMTVSASPGSYAIEVGRAAAGNPAPEHNGKPTTFNGLTAYGGGAGARAGNPPGLDAQPGGSGGGGSANSIAGYGPSSPNQGNAGGDGASGNSSNGKGAGGGGASEDGKYGSGDQDGGAGIMFDDAGFFKLSVGGITDNPGQPGYRYLAGGGGGGGTTNAPSSDGIGGFGGGGDAGNPNGNGGNADNWSGAGGGAGGGGDQTRFGGQGGQGMLFIRYVAD